MNTYTAVIYREGELYVAECPEVDSISQGRTIEETKRPCTDNHVQCLNYADILYRLNLLFVRGSEFPHVLAFHHVEVGDGSVLCKGNLKLYRFSRNLQNRLRQ